jgi:hypothetical protein
MVKHRQLARQVGAFGAIAFESSVDLKIKIRRGFRRLSLITRGSSCRSSSTTRCVRTLSSSTLFVEWIYAASQWTLDHPQRSWHPARSSNPPTKDFGRPYNNQRSLQDLKKTSRQGRALCVAAATCRLADLLEDQPLAGSGPLLV